MKSQDIAQGSDSLRVKRQTTTLREMVYQKLRQAIIDHDLPPGSKLIERDLCERLRISRPSLREALHRLEAEKLIKMVPHKGAVVAILTAQDVREIQNIRVVIGHVVCDKFVDAATDAEETVMNGLRDQINAALHAQDHMAVSTCLSAFQDALLTGSGDMVCREILGTLNARVEIIQRLSIGAIWDVPPMRAELEAMISAAGSRDRTTLKQCLANWLNHETSNALNHLPNADGEGRSASEAVPKDVT